MQLGANDYRAPFGPYCSHLQQKAIAVEKSASKGSQGMLGELKRRRAPLNP